MRIDALEESGSGKTYAQLQANPGQIRIRTSRIEADWVEIGIGDNGVGMSEQIQQRIFDPFFTTKPWEKGQAWGCPSVIKSSQKNIVVSSSVFLRSGKELSS